MQPSGSDQPPSTGVLIADRYLLIEPIARGGVAWVWRAHDQRLDHPVAIKIVRADADPSLAERLHSEAQVAAKVKHTGVVSVIDAGVHDGVPFLAMELIEGWTLRQMLNERDQLDPVVAATILHQVAAAADAIRRAGLVHGDLKPDNIVVSQDLTAKITDLGLAHAVWEQGTDSDRHLYGTPGYLAPERHAGEAGDHRSDVFALGAVLYECLSGIAPPANGRIDPHTIPSSVPSDLVAVVERATSKDPRARYETASAMASQLATLDREPGSETTLIDSAERETVALKAPPPTRSLKRSLVKSPSRFSSFWLPNRWVAALLALALLLGFVVLGPLRQTTVPQLVGLSQAAAREAIQDAGLDFDSEVIYDSLVPAGQVIDSNPESGAGVRKGGKVLVRISLGPRLVKVPETRKMPPEEATATLQAAGFANITELQIFNDFVAAGFVVGTQPVAGESADADAEIALRVSKGVDRVEVPDVVGDKEEKAVSTLEAEGFLVVVEPEASRSVKEGIVIRTEPDAGSKPKRGATVVVVVSSGVPEVTVPDLRCMTKKNAESAIKARRLSPDTRGNGNRVVDQSPSPGEKLREGSRVTIYMGIGAFCGGDDD